MRLSAIMPFNSMASRATQLSTSHLIDRIQNPLTWFFLIMPNETMILLHLMQPWVRWTPQPCLLHWIWSISMVFMGPNGIIGWSRWSHWIGPDHPIGPDGPIGLDDIEYGLSGPKGSFGRYDQTWFKNTNEPDDNAGPNVQTGHQAWQFHIKIR